MNEKNKPWLKKLLEDVSRANYKLPDWARDPEELKKSNEDRKDIADKILKTIDDYLTNGGWQICHNTLFWKDPITDSLHHTMTALNIQLDRDLSKI